MSANTIVFIVTDVVLAALIVWRVVVYIRDRRAAREKGKENNA